MLVDAAKVFASNETLNDPFKPVVDPVPPGATDPIGAGYPYRVGPTHTYREWAVVEPVLDLHTFEFLAAYGTVTVHKMCINTVYLHLAAIGIHPPPPDFMTATQGATP
jgi:hypothetical protein